MGCAGLQGARLVVALGFIMESEEMHLVVARNAPPGVVVDQARAPDALVIFAGDGGGAADDPDAVFLGRGGQKILHRTLAIGLAHRDLG